MCELLCLISQPTPSNIAAAVFPECVARVPVSLWGSGGWGCVRSTLRLWSQPSATVRNRSQPFVWGPYGRAYRCHFWRFPRFVASFRVAAVALCDKSRAKCSFWCSHLLSRLASLVLRWLRRVYGRSCKILSACFKLLKLEEVSHEMRVLVRPRVSSRVSCFPLASPCL